MIRAAIKYGLILLVMVLPFWVIAFDGTSYYLVLLLMCLVSTLYLAFYSPFRSFGNLPKVKVGLGLALIAPYLIPIVSDLLNTTHEVNKSVGIALIILNVILAIAAFGFEPKEA